MQKEYVVFRLGHSKYGVLLEYFKDLLPYEVPMVVENMPDHLHGVISYEDQMIPIINLEKEFDVKGPSALEDRGLMVMTYDSYSFGLVVSEFTSGIVLEDKDVFNSGAIAMGFKNDFIRGLGLRESEIVLLLDMRKLLY